MLKRKADFMALNIKRPNGTEDVVPKDVHKWHTIEKIARDTAESLALAKSVSLPLKIPTFSSVL